MPLNLAHGWMRRCQVLALDRMFSLDTQEMETGESDKHTRNGDDRKGGGNDEDEGDGGDDNYEGGNDDFEDGSDNCENGIENYEDEGYEYDEHNICDHGLVLQAIGWGTCRRVGVFRSYLQKRGQTLFEVIAKIAIE